MINVSNAPPVSLKRKESGEWMIGQGSGGLVTCCEPALAANNRNQWLACFGPAAPFRYTLLSPSLSPSFVHLPLYRKESGTETPLGAAATNSLGIPLMRTAQTEVRSQVGLGLGRGWVRGEEAGRGVQVLQNTAEGSPAQKSEVEEQMSLLGVLSGYNKSNAFKLNPVVVAEDDYNTYYGGISNGLLWPACHGLGEYIVEDYNDAVTLNAHWAAYVRVNYLFAINAVRTSRPQDFIWIHDYHLMLTGLIMQALDPHLEVPLPSLP